MHHLKSEESFQITTIPRYKYLCYEHVKGFVNPQMQLVDLAGKSCFVHKIWRRLNPIKL